MSRAYCGKPTAAIMLGGSVAGFIPVTRRRWNAVHWTPAMDLGLRRLHLIGYPPEVCAERIGVGAEVAENRLRDLGLPLRRNRVERAA